MWHLEIVEDDCDDTYGDGELNVYIHLHRDDGTVKYYNIHSEWRGGGHEYHWPAIKTEDMPYNVDVDAKKLYVTVNGSSFEYELASYKQCFKVYSPMGSYESERIVF